MIAGDSIGSSVNLARLGFSWILKKHKQQTTTTKPNKTTTKNSAKTPCWNLVLKNSVQECVTFTLIVYKILALKKLTFIGSILSGINHLGLKTQIKAKAVIWQAPYLCNESAQELVLAVVYKDYQLIKLFIVSQSHGIPITALIAAEIITGGGSVMSERTS